MKRFVFNEVAWALSALCQAPSIWYLWTDWQQLQPIPGASDWRPTSRSVFSSTSNSIRTGRARRNTDNMLLTLLNKIREKATRAQRYRRLLQRADALVTLKSKKTVSGTWSRDEQENHSSHGDEPPRRRKEHRAPGHDVPSQILRKSGRQARSTGTRTFWEELLVVQKGVRPKTLTRTKALSTVRLSSLSTFAKRHHCETSAGRLCVPRE